jgi:hypothetical protein
MDDTGSSPFLHFFRRNRPAARRILPSPLTINTVAVYFSRHGAPMFAHEKATLYAVAEGIARLNGCRYDGVFDVNKHSTGDVFFVPDDTLMLDDARNLGIHSPASSMARWCPICSPKQKPSRTG